MTNKTSLNKEIIDIMREEFSSNFEYDDVWEENIDEFNFKSILEKHLLKVETSSKKEEPKKKIELLELQEGSTRCAKINEIINFINNN